MAADDISRPGRVNVAEHRSRLRAKGLRPIQYWVPDVTTPEFAAEAKRQSLLVANSPFEAEDQAFIDSLSVLTDDDFEWE